MYKNRIRLPVMFIKPQFPMERNTFRLANGVTKVQSVVIRNTFEGKTDQLPEAWHRKLVIALAHDEVTIENERLMSDVVLDGDYEIDWQDFLQYPIAQSNFKVQVTPFNATNSNCITCEEAAQLSLVDDYTDEIWDEGTTHDFPDVLTDNDYICCQQYVISLSSYNTVYFSAVSITAAGVLTATVKTPVPDITDVLIGTYRVTCPDGSYDEANVYGNINGAGAVCAPVTSIVSTQISDSSTELEWSPVAAAPAIFNWELFLTSDLGTVIQSGSEPAGSSSVILTGLTTGVSYTFVLIVDCSGVGTNLSAPYPQEFELTEVVSESCGNFTISCLDAAEVLTCSYMDCLGVIVDLVFNQATVVDKCMLITPGSATPFYFVVSSPLITVTYIGLC